MICHYPSHHIRNDFSCQFRTLVDFFLGKPRTIYISSHLQGKFSIDPSLTVTQQPAKENEKNWFVRVYFFLEMLLVNLLNKFPVYGKLKTIIKRKHKLQFKLKRHPFCTKK